MLLSSASILVLEDQIEICDLIQMALAHESKIVFIANTLEEAKKIVEREKIDLAIVDSGLPDGNPFTFIKKLLNNHCRVISMSGNFETNELIAQLSLPQLEKPFRLKTLLDITQKTLSDPVPILL